jgi:hypothetical protein
VRALTSRGCAGAPPGTTVAAGQLNWPVSGAVRVPVSGSCACLTGSIRAPSGRGVPCVDRQRWCPQTAPPRRRFPVRHACARPQHAGEGGLMVTLAHDPARAPCRFPRVPCGCAAPGRAGSSTRPARHQPRPATPPARQFGRDRAERCPTRSAGRAGGGSGPPGPIVRNVQRRPAGPETRVSVVRGRSRRHPPRPLTAGRSAGPSTGRAPGRPPTSEPAPPTPTNPHVTPSAASSFTAADS